MVTFWVTPLALEQTTENKAPEIKVYPNPVSDYVIVEAEGLESIILTDINGLSQPQGDYQAGLSQWGVGGLLSHLLWFMSSSRCISWWFREAFTGFSSFLGLMSSGFHSLCSGRAIRPPMSARSLWISEYMEAGETTQQGRGSWSDEHTQPQPFSRHS